MGASMVVLFAIWNPVLTLSPVHVRYRGRSPIAERSLT